MEDPRLAGENDARLLAELFCKQLQTTGMAKGNCEEEHRDELISWLRARCAEEKVWVIDGEQGPVALACYERTKNEIVSVVVRDGMERRGVATEMIRSFQAKEQFLRALPVTRGGKALIQACGFREAENALALAT